MKNALVIGSSGGIGAAIYHELRGRGCDVDALSRRDTGFDLLNPDHIQQQLKALDGPYDVIIVATGALVIDGQGPEKSIKSVTADGMAAQFAVNAIGPALILAHMARLLPKTVPAKVGVLSARVGSIGDNALGGWTSYRASKAALNQIVKTTSVELRRSHPNAALAALHPGTVETEFTRAYLGRHASVPADVAAKNLVDVLDQLQASDTGGFFDYAGAPVPW